MGREHLLTDNPEAIAFGRGRLSALRAAGKRYVTQVYDTPFGRVTVRIVGGVEYISAEPGGWDYLVRPASFTNPLGVTRNEENQEISPRALLGLGSSDIKVREHVEHEAGPHDWISSDYKRCISYDHGCGFRHSATNDFPYGVTGIWERGSKQETLYAVRGAAVFTGAGSTTLYATYRDGAYAGILQRIVVCKLTPSGETEIANYELPADVTVIKPTYFSGDGSKFCTLLAGFKIVGEVGGFVAQLTGARFTLVGEIAEDPNTGDLTVVMNITATPMKPDEGPETTEAVHTSDNRQPRWVSSANGLEATNYVQDEYEHVEEPGVRHRIMDRSVRTATGSSSTRQATYALLGMDMSSDGEVLYVWKRKSTVSESNDEWSQRYFQDRTTWTVETSPGTFTEFVDTSTSMDEHFRRSIRSTAIEEWMVNDSVVLRVDTYSAVGDYGSDAHYGYQYTGPLYAVPPVKTTRTPFDNGHAPINRSLGVRDFDPRHLAASYNVATVPYPNKSFVGTVHAVFDGQERSKVVFSGESRNTALAHFATTGFISRRIATRRDGEWVMSASANQSIRADSANNLRFFTGSFDPAPLLWLHKTGRDFTTEKFSIHGESGFDLPSICTL